MYEAFFGLLQRPFAAVPSTHSYFPAEVVEQSRLALIRTIERAEGVGLIIGPAGTGKTLLCQMLAAHWAQHFSIVMLSSARLCTRRALLQNILFELRLPFRDMEEGELRLSLVDHLQPSALCPHGMLLLIDEGHTLPLRILEEVRLITNLVRDGQPRVRLILSGSAQLEERLASPRLESFNQRIATRSYLHAFTQHETTQYVQHQVQLAGGRPEGIFADEAYRALYLATDGIPRLINQVCDHVMMLAYAGGRRRIDARGVEEAWADLQRLPTPWTSDGTSSEGIIEFGQLDESNDDDDELREDAFEQNDAGVFADEVTDTATATLISTDEGVEIHFSQDLGESWEATGAADSAAGDASQPAPQTAAPAATWVAKDPFGGSFTDEEIVLDNFHSWDRSASRELPRVLGVESRELAAALRSVTAADVPAQENRQHAHAPETAEELCAATVVDLASLAEEALGAQVQTIVPVLDAAGDYTAQQLVHLPSFDDLVGASLPCDAACEDDAPLRPIGGPGQQVFRRFEADDRDIIVIEDEHPLKLTVTSGSARATRQEYRRLFGQLRRS